MREVWKIIGVGVLVFTGVACKEVVNKATSKADSSVKRCTCCEEEFGVTKWRYTCELCGKTVCDDCLKEHIEQRRYCKTCMQYATNNVEDVSINYKGNKHGPYSQEKSIKTNWFTNPKNALQELKMETARHECNIVYNVDYNRSQEEESNGYKYKLWQAVGMAAKNNGKQW